MAATLLRAAIFLLKITAEIRTDYVMYPRTTETVDNAMTIETDGTQPDHYFRLWFCFQKVEDGVVPAFELPDIVPASHERTALVEWGGMILP